MFCNSNRDVHWTMSTIPIIWNYYTVASAIIDNYHNANFGNDSDKLNSRDDLVAPSGAPFINMD